MQNQIVTEMADDEGVISPEKSEIVQPSVDVEINIRQDDIRLFEGESNSLYIRTPEMEDGVFIEPVPTSEGVVADVVIGVQETLTEVEPADPAPQPDVDSAAATEIQERMD